MRGTHQSLEQISDSKVKHLKELSLFGVNTLATKNHSYWGGPTNINSPLWFHVIMQQRTTAMQILWRTTINLYDEGLRQVLQATGERVPCHKVFLSGRSRGIYITSKSSFSPPPIWRNLFFPNFLGSNGLFLPFFHVFPHFLYVDGIYITSKSKAPQTERLFRNKYYWN